MRMLTEIPMKMELGEGPVWHRFRKSWCWFDILNQCLYELPFNTESPQKHQLPIMATAMAVYDEKQVLIVSETLIATYNLETCKLIEISQFNIPDDMRTNDGGMGFDGRFWFSTMQKKPNEAKGNIYSLSPSLEIEKHIEDIAIPNTMVWSTNMRCLLLSDSLYQKTYAYSYQGTKFTASSTNLFIDLQNTAATPDGGALDSDGNIWIALWGGHSVTCFSSSGDKIDEIKLPVPQPSSCCFGGPNNQHLIITSAREGLSQDDLNEYPLSGSIFIAELNVKGVEIPGFKLEKSC